MRVVWAAALLAWLWLAGPWSDPGGRLEGLLYDVRLAVAGWLRPAVPAWNPRIVVVGVEPESYAQIPEHWVFWLGHYSRVARRALDGGARVVGLDFIPTYAAPRDLAEFAALTRTYPDRLVVASHWDGRGKITAPAPALVTLLGVQNLALASTSLDGDGLARAQSVEPLFSDTALYGRRDWSFLAAELARRAGAEDPWTRDGRIYLELASGSPSRVPFHSPVSGDFWRDAVVLIGSRDKSDQDLVSTPNPEWRPGQPFSRSGFGVDYQAQVLNNLLSAGGLRPFPVGLAWLLLSGLLSGLLWGSRRSGLLLQVGALVLAVSIWLGVALAGYLGAGWLLPLSAGCLGLPCSWAGAMAYRSRREAEARRRLHQTISGYVAPEILREMLAAPESWLRSLNQRRDVTVLFSDINDFSGASERYPPEEVATWLDLHYREMSRVIFAHQGTILRFVGDQFMVLFGSPKGLDRPEEAAVAAARAMHRRLHELKAAGGPGFFEIKIGIHRGSLLLAVIGDDLKREYTAVGDEANVAARIQDLCKRVGRETLISREVWDCLRDREGVEDQGEWEIKGRRGRVRVYSVATGLQPSPPTMEP